jgi:CheY-like chemotaxis protein
VNDTLTAKDMGAKILIIDDEAPIRTLLRSAVAETGFTVFEADSGRKALEIASQEAPFALVVTDVLMPEMDGFEVAEALRRAGQARSFLFISGYCDAGSLAEKLAMFPAAAFLSKPFPIPDLIRAVRRLLDPVASEVRDRERRTA